MYEIIVTLFSNKQNEINHFLNKYFNKNMEINQNVFKWSYIYSNPLESVDLISAIYDNQHLYNIELFIQINNSPLIQLTSNNVESVIKYIYFTYY